MTINKSAMYQFSISLSGQLCLLTEIVSESSLLTTMADSVQTEYSVTQTGLPESSDGTGTNFLPVTSPGRRFIIICVPVQYAYGKQGDKIPTRWDVWPRSISKIRPNAIPLIDDVHSTQEHSESLETAPSVLIRRPSVLLSDAGAIVDKG
jgi:hypothetical protein